MHVSPLAWLGSTFLIADGAAMVGALSGTEYGQAALAVLVAAVGYVLNRKSQQIHVLVNARMTAATEQIRVQNVEMVAQDKRIVALEHALSIMPGAKVPPPD